MRKQDWSPRRQGFVIVGFVRRGGGEPQESAWTGTSWSRRKGRIYRTQQEAAAAMHRIDIRPVDSMTILAAR